jgi:hypothetical protein
LDQNNKHNELNPNYEHKDHYLACKGRNRNGEETQDCLSRSLTSFRCITGLLSLHISYDKAQSSSKEEVSDHTYRYPGPKPQTKETGIVMLADAIEASTRTIEEPSPQKLENNIREVIRRRFMEGELDECDLTLKDLTKIKDSFPEDSGRYSSPQIEISGSRINSNFLPKRRHLTITDGDV